MACDPNTKYVALSNSVHKTVASELIATVYYVSFECGPRQPDISTDCGQDKMAAVLQRTLWIFFYKSCFIWNQISVEFEIVQLAIIQGWFR